MDKVRKPNISVKILITNTFWTVVYDAILLLRSAFLMETNKSPNYVKLSAKI
jgi:hypothetical protein